MVLAASLPWRTFFPRPDRNRSDSGLPSFKGFFHMVPLIVAAVLSVFVRLRRSVGIERQQLKLFATLLRRSP